MDRRQFLAAAIGALAGRSVRAQPDCDFADCKLPPINPGHIDAGKAGRFERPAGLTKRPLWSKLSIPEKARLFSTLQKAYQRMSRMCPRDPRSLAFQAWLHQYYCCNHKASHARSFPGAATNIHNTSDFLPWHRAFLFFHERIIQGVSGNKDFRLPVWDWESPCGFQTPWPYDSMPLPVVPCKCSPRRETVAPITPFCLQEWLTSGSFDEFAGPPGPESASGAKPGCATLGPHSSVHISLRGYMGQVAVAAIDPVFYAHHANIDRYWEYWRSLYKGRPGFKEHWPDSSEYYFYDGFHHWEKPRLVKVTPCELLDIGALGYCYDPPTLTMPGWKEVCAKPAGETLLSFDKSSFDILSPFLSTTASTGLSAHSRVGGQDEKQALAARFSIGIPNPQPAFYDVAIANPAGDSPVPVGGFAAFVERDAELTPFCSGSCVISLMPDRIRTLIERSAPFQLMYALAPDEPDENLPHQRTSDRADVKWVAATPPVSFEFLVPETPSSIRA